MKQTVIVTGGSRGIGFATAQLFAQNGWQVVLCSRNGGEAQKAAASISQTTNNSAILGIETDVGDKASVAALFSATIKKFGALDALVNNAAVLHTGTIWELSDGQFSDMFRINVEGLTYCCREAFALMKKTGGSIVNISSVAGIQNTGKFPGLWAYAASKFAVTGLTEALAAEGRSYNIRVNAVAPGATDTEMLQKAAPGFKPNAQPADIAPVVYYLCDTKQSGILTGSIIPVFSNS